MYAEKVTTSALRTGLAKLYETHLMFGGGHVAGYAVDEAQGERVVQAVHALAVGRRLCSDTVCRTKRR